MSVLSVSICLIYVPLCLSVCLSLYGSLYSPANSTSAAAAAVVNDGDDVSRLAFHGRSANRMELLFCRDSSSGTNGIDVQNRDREQDNQPDRGRQTPSNMYRLIVIGLRLNDRVSDEIIAFGLNLILCYVCGVTKHKESLNFT